jgi:hypothetical protein
LLFLDRQEQLEFGGQLLLAVQPIRKIYSSNTAVCVNCNPQGLDVVGPVGSPSEVRQVELDLVPALVQTHRHSTDERLHSSCGLIVRGPETPTNILVVQDLHLESEVFF